MGHGRLSEISRNIIDIGIGMIRSIPSLNSAKTLCQGKAVHRVSAGRQGAKVD